MARGPDVTQPMPAVLGDGGGDPRWLGALLEHPFVLRARAMGRALLLLLLTPTTFGRAWTRGVSDIPNPAIALATALSIIALIAEATNALLHRDVAHTILTSARESLALYLQTTLIGVVAHPILRLLGSRRRLLTSVGVTFLATAGWGTVFGVFRSLATLAVAARYGAGADLGKVAPVWVNGLVIGLFAVWGVYVCAVTQLALAGAHGVSRWKGVVAGTIAILLGGNLTELLPQSMQMQNQLPELKASTGWSHVSAK
jgi:hypothetical protein